MTFWGLPEKYLIGMTIWIVALVVLLRVLLKLRRRGHESKVRKRIANAGLSIWLLLVLLTSIEFGFALFYDRTDSFDMSNVSHKWFARYGAPFEKPLRFDNGEGFLYRDDRTFSKEIPAGKHHICFLGDSFTYGHGINRVGDRFSNLIRRRLDETHPGKFIVSNLGKAGTDLNWAEATLKNLFADGVRVDTAVYTICLNDIESFDPAIATYYSGSWRAGSSVFLFRDTYFFNLLYFRFRQFQRPQVKNYYDFVREYYEGEPWSKMAAKIGEINALCRKNGCQLRIVVFPFLQNLGPDYPFEFAHKEIVDRCRELDIPVLDLLPVLRPHTDEGLVVSPFDAHPNERANRYAADAIESSLLADFFESE